MLTGEKRPMTGATGCHFLAGAWSQLDAILGLPKSRVYGNTGAPNQTKPGKGFSQNGKKFATTDILAIDDFSGNPISHIAAKKLEGSLVRPEYREVPVVRLARERTQAAFFILIPTKRGTHV